MASKEGELLPWLTNSANWSAYANGTSGGVRLSGMVAVGGPTRPQFWASYNGKKGTSYSAEDQSGLDTSDKLYFTEKMMEKADDGDKMLYGYWLLSTAHEWFQPNLINLVQAYSWVQYGCDWDMEYVGIRPLVQVPTTVRGLWKNNTWTLSL